MSKIDLPESWLNKLAKEFEQPYMAVLKSFLLTERSSGKSIFPTNKDLFRALNATSLENVKVVILGQDPYHGPGQAHGLCFSVPDGVALPPSLVNIFKELASDLNIPVSKSGNLQHWANQGVLLLNATLSVEAHKAGSHQGKGWEQFTDAVIKTVNDHCDNVVFMLWGSFAQKKCSGIDPKKHLILQSPHPSPLSSYRGFFGCKHFSKANSYLKQHGREPIDWQLPELASSPEKSKNVSDPKSSGQKTKTSTSKNLRNLNAGLIALVFFGVSVFVSTVHAQANLRIFRYCSEGSPATFNPALVTDSTTFNASARPIYNRLLEFERGGTKVEPSLAKSWEISADGLTVTFHLRSDVEFHSTPYFSPTRKLNADDILFTFERMLKSDHPYHRIGGGTYPTFQATQMGSIIANVKKQDDYTVVFKLHRPDATFFADMAMSFGSIFSAEYGQLLLKKKTPEKIDKDPIGTGPFVFVSYEKDKKIIYRANKNYFAGVPKVSELHIVIEPSPQGRFEKLINKTCDFMSAPTNDQLVKSQKDKNLKVYSQPGLNVLYLAMNTTKPPFTDVRVRKALRFGINRDLLVTQVFEGNAKVSKGPIPPAMWAYSRALPDYAYDVMRAKQLLKDAGIPEGTKIDLWYSGISRVYNPEPKKLVLAITRELARIGIVVNPVEMEWGEFLQKSRRGDPVLSIQGWSTDNGDPDNMLGNLLSCASIGAGNNRARWCNKEYSFRVDRARVTTNIRQRKKFYDEAQLRFYEETPWVPVAHATVFKIANQNIDGYRMSPFGTDDFSQVSFK
jgi:dipeptide transport system substrate-binding protein